MVRNSIFSSWLKVSEMTEDEGSNVVKFQFPEFYIQLSFKEDGEGESIEMTSDREPYNKTYSGEEFAERVFALLPHVLQTYDGVPRGVDDGAI